MSVLFQIYRKWSKYSYVSKCWPSQCGAAAVVTVLLKRTNWLQAWKRELPRDKRSWQLGKGVGIKQKQPRKGKQDGTNGLTKRRTWQ
jgi:hypothetical protein